MNARSLLADLVEQIDKGDFKSKAHRANAKDLLAMAEARAFLRDGGLGPHEFDDIDYRDSCNYHEGPVYCSQPKNAHPPIGAGAAPLATLIEHEFVTPNPDKEELLAREHLCAFWYTVKMKGPKRGYCAEPWLRHKSPEERRG